MLKRQTRNIRSGIIDRQQKSSTTTDVSIIAPDLSEAKQEADELQESIAQMITGFLWKYTICYFCKNSSRIKTLGRRIIHERENKSFDNPPIIK